MDGLRLMVLMGFPLVEYYVFSEFKLALLGSLIGDVLERGFVAYMNIV